MSESKSERMEIDVYWSFRSPWSYLATRRLRDWQEQFQLQVNFRVVYPIAIRTPEFFQQVQPQWFSYFQTDVYRVAEFLQLPFVWPNPDPVIQLTNEEGERQTGAEQPYIHRLSRLGALAEEMGRGIEFVDEVSSLIWGGTKNWDHGDHLARATQSAGLDLAEMDRRVVDEADRLESVIQKNQVDHDHAGHWGVPTCVFKDEPFFGQDRLDVLLWRLKKEGLQTR
ncbi:MAG: 2-hydroxychromene-2-carboxylate isomerase [Pseudomonadales bacterium]|nr:2-hydroxychromene-2-carboxylate isomerase [Pseudomonadales bacterium]